MKKEMIQGGCTLTQNQTVESLMRVLTVVLLVPLQLFRFFCSFHIPLTWCGVAVGEAVSAPVFSLPGTLKLFPPLTRFALGRIGIVLAVSICRSTKTQSGMNLRHGVYA